VFLTACDVVGDGVTVPGQRVLEEPAQFAGRDLFLKVTDVERFTRERVSTYPAIGYATLADILPTTLVAKREPLLLGPFRVVVSFVDAGLDVDLTMRILDANAAPVAGLYACGSAGVGGMRLEGHGHHLLWAAHSGLTAAGAIALAE
jgi:fumarate reductase flavoprotein subunit